MTFSQYGVTAFTVQGSNGGGTWVTLGTVTGNNLVKRTVNFTAATYDRIRINVTAALASYARITEIEAWGNVGPLTLWARTRLHGAKTLAAQVRRRRRRVGHPASLRNAAMGVFGSNPKGTGAWGVTLCCSPRQDR